MKKLSLRYSNKGIGFLIISFLILANIFIYNVDGLPNIREFNKENVSEFVINRAVNNELDRSIHLSGYPEDDNKYIKYFSYSRVYDNFLATEEYKSNNPDKTVFQYGSETITVNNYVYEDIVREYGNKYPVKETEEPVYSNQYSTNFKDYRGVNRNIVAEIENKMKEPFVLVNYTRGGELETKRGNDANLTENQEQLMDRIVDYLNKNIRIQDHIQDNYTAQVSFDIEEELDISYYGRSNNEIASFNAIYELTPETKEIGVLIDNTYNLTKYFVNGLYVMAIAFIIFVLMATFTDYELSKEVGFYKWLRAIPIEVYAAILFLASIAGYYITFLISLNYQTFIATLAGRTWIFVIIGSIALLILIFAIYYIVQFFKSLYREGIRNFVFKNSVIVRFTIYIYNLFKKFVLWSYSVLIGKNIGSKLLWIGVFAAAFFFMLFGIGIGRGVEFLFILFVFVYLVVSKFIKDYNVVEDGLNQVGRGNFDVKIDEINTSFSKMASDVNNISDSLQTAVEKELQSERMKTELITNVSHDLKTPLTSIINYSDLASKEDATDEDIKKYVKIINEKSLKLKSLIENLFEISKVTSKNIELNKMDIDIVQMLSQAIGEWADELDQRDIDVIMNSNKETIINNLDGEQTYRIFDNLFSNINKYAQENTRVYIDIEQNELKTKIIMKNVSRYSLNISADELKERFTRGDDARNTEGSGLGLAIASSLTELQGGNFNISIDGDLFKIIIEFYN